MKDKANGEEGSYREKPGCHTIGREGRIKDEAAREILDGVLEDEVDERSIAKDEHDRVTAQ